MEFHRATFNGLLSLDDVSATITGYDGPTGNCGQMTGCTAVLEGRLGGDSAVQYLGGGNFYNGQTGPLVQSFIGTLSVKKINAMRVTISGALGTSSSAWVPVLDVIPAISLTAVVTRFDRDPATTNTVWNVTADVENYVGANGICTDTTCQLALVATLADGTKQDISGGNITAYYNVGLIDVSAEGGLGPVESVQLRLSGADRVAWGQVIGVEDNAGPTLPAETVGGANPSENVCPCMAGDPVNAATGEFYLPSTDISLPGKGPAVGVARTYSSTNAATDGAFGYGWADSFSTHLTVLTPGDAADPLPRQVQIVQENGSTVVFRENASHHYVAPPRVLASLAFDSSTNQWTFTRRAVQTMVFDSTGLLLSQTDPNGNTVSYTYTSGHVTGITGPGSRSVALTWASGHVIGIADSAGRTISYGYASGNLTSVAAVDGAVTHYGYASGHYLTTMTSPEGGVTTNVYDSSHRVESQGDALNRETTFGYDGTITTVTDPVGAVTKERYYGNQLVTINSGYGTSSATTTKYEHDPAGNTSSIRDGLGNVTKFTFDDRGNRLSATDAIGNKSTWTYSALNAVTSATDALNRQTSFTYDADGNPLTATTAGGRVTHLYSNSDGTVDHSTDARGKSRSYSYNSAGLLTGTTDPDSRTTHVAYDPAGHVTSTTDPAGKVTALTSDAMGRVLSLTDPNSHTTTNSYDDDGNLTATEDANGHTVSKAYDDADQLVSATDARGKTTTFTYTGAGSLASSTDPNGHTSTTSYNKLAQVTSATDPNNHTTHYTYDDAGRPLTTELPSGNTSSMTYDAAGRMVTTTDGKGKVTKYAYDAAGQSVSTTDPLGRTIAKSYTDDGQIDTITLPDSSTEGYTYNANGQPTGFTNADGKHTTYSYDDADLLTSKIEPGGLTTGYNYDSAGRMQVETKPDGSTLTNSYDDAGRLTSIHSNVSGSTDVDYTYDPVGQRATMHDQTGTSSYGYNANGQTSSVTDGHGAALAFGYDKAGRRTSITYPGGRAVTYGYDDGDRMSSVTDWNSHETDFTWTVDDQLNTQADANGVIETRSYDAANQTTGIATANGGGALTNYGYTHDAAGQISADSTVDSSGTRTHDYEYDKTSQLTTVASASASSAYAATPAGQLTSDTNGNALTYNSAQQLTGVTPSVGAATALTYSENGSRLTSTVAAAGSTPAASTTFTYDPWENLTTAVVLGDAPVTVSYTSDGDGLRQSRSVGSASEQFLWDVSGSLPLLLDDGDHSYLYGPSSAPIAQIDDTSGATQYLHGDLVGSTRLITSGAGAEAATITYDPYGNRAGHTGTADSRMGYTGNWTDPDSALVYLRARNYDPATGQFTTLDPAIDQTRQPYTYVANDPLARTDPLGLCWIAAGTGDCGELYDDINTAANEEAVNIFGFVAGVGAGLADSVDGNPCWLANNDGFQAGLTVAPSIMLVLAFEGAKSGATQELSLTTTGRSRPYKTTAGEKADGSAPAVKVNADFQFGGGGRGGQNVKDFVGPPNSVVKGAVPGRVFRTDSLGRVVEDITKARVKPVTPGRGFTSGKERKDPPSKEQLRWIEELWD